MLHSLPKEGYSFHHWMTNHVSTVKPLNNGPPEERPLVNNGQILFALAYFNTFATLNGGHP